MKRRKIRIWNEERINCRQTRELTYIHSKIPDQTNQNCNFISIPNCKILRTDCLVSRSNLSPSFSHSSKISSQRPVRGERLSSIMRFCRMSMKEMTAAKAGTKARSRESSRECLKTQIKFHLYNNISSNIKVLLNNSTF